jgi:hypothetical protein
MIRRTLGCACTVGENLGKGDIGISWGIQRAVREVVERELLFRTEAKAIQTGSGRPLTAKEMTGFLQSLEGEEKLRSSGG